MSRHARTVRSTPHRSATETWEFIVDMIAPSPSPARADLLAVSGIAASLIASESPRDSAIVVHSGGPQVLLRCLYDEDAITGDGAKEDKLPRSPTEGSWRVSLPAAEEDLGWVTEALAKKTSRVTARAIGEDADTEEKDAGRSEAGSATIDPEAFLRP